MVLELTKDFKCLEEIIIFLVMYYEIVKVL